MSQEADRRIAEMPGDAALPRSNGELVFEAPWEGRAFGVAVSMNEAGRYEWGEFRDRLVEQIRGSERDSGTASTYYERWVSSLERLLIEKGLVTAEELDVRTAEYASGARED